MYERKDMGGEKRVQMNSFLLLFEYYYLNIIIYLILLLLNIIYASICRMGIRQIVLWGMRQIVL